MDSKNLIIDGITYISSSSAGDLAGYTADYVARLARTEEIKGVQIARQWFVDEKAFYRYLEHKRREKERSRRALMQERQHEYAVAQRSSLLPVSLDVFNKLTALAVALIVTVGPYAASHHPTFADIDDRVRALASIEVPDVRTVAAVATRAVNHRQISNFVQGTVFDVRAFGEFSRQSLLSYTKSVAMHTGGLAQKFADASRSVSVAPALAAVHSVPVAFDNFFDDADERVSSMLLSSSRTVDAQLAQGSLAALDSIEGVLDVVQRVFDETVFSIQVRMLAMLNNDSTPTVAVQPDEPEGSSDEGVVTDGEGSVDASAGTPTAPRSPINEVVTERVIETQYVVRETGLSTAEVEGRLKALENKLTAQIFNLEAQSGNNATRIINNYNTISQTNKIDDLGSVTIHDSSITDSSFSGTSVSADSGSFGSLSVSGALSGASATFSGALTGQSTATFYGLLSVPSLSATSTTATSTFAGGVTVDGNLGIGTSTPDSPLSVTGNIYADGTITTSNVTATSTITTTDLIASNGTTTNATSTNLSVSNILSVTNSAATSTFAGGITIESSGFIYDYSTNRVGIGTDSPTQSLEVSGSGYFTGGLGIGIATTTAGVLETSGNAYIGGDLTVLGDSIVFGASTADSVTINSTINSNLIPDQNAVRDIGSPAFYWDDGYFDTITANNLSAASSTISGTQSADFSINTDNSSADIEDINLIFYRGTVVPNALITWDSTFDRFDFNQPAFFQNDSSTTTRVSLDVWGKSGQSADLFRVASSSGTSFFNIASSGNVGIGTTTPAALLAVGGAAYFDDSITVGDIIATGTITSSGLTSTGALTATRFVATDANATSTFAGGIAVETSGLVYDYSTGRVGIGTASPGQTLSVAGSADVTGALTLGTALAASEGGTGVTTFGGTNTVLYTTAADTLASDADFVFDGIRLGVGTSTPAWTLSVAGAGSFDDYVRTSYFVATSTTASSTLVNLNVSGSLNFDGTLYQNGSEFTSSPWTQSGNDLSYTTGNVGIGTTTPNNKLQVTGSAGPQLLLTDSLGGADLKHVFASSTAGSLTFGSLNDNLSTYTERFRIDSAGNVGIGTTTPWKRLSVTEEVADAQLSVAYDATRYANFQVDSTGDLIIDPQGDDVRLNDDNLYVCSGGSCPAGTPAGTGNIIAESNLGVGTSTPSAQFAVANNLFVGGGGSPALGTATSTYEGDIIIHGKLDVGTIDPVYTIAGVKYATYGHSTIGIKEETIVTFQVRELNPTTGNYEHRIHFSDLKRGSDLWLFYQVTDFGRDWRKLVISATPGFDGRVFYEKNADKNELVIAADQPGEVSLRLAADRFDASKWPNLRPDQNEGFRGHIIPEKK